MGLRSYLPAVAVLVAGLIYSCVCLGDSLTITSDMQYEYAFALP